MPITLETLRRYAVARTLFAPTTLPKAITQFDGRAAKSNRRGTVLCAGARRGSPTGGGRALCSRQFTQMVWRRDAFHRAKERLAHAQVDGQTYYWPATENPASRRRAPDEVVRLLAPFDPLVWDRRRFEHLWGWAYRFEAYTPAPKRVRGYYALPLLWGEQVIGWGNVSMVGGRMQAEWATWRASRRPGRHFLRPWMRNCSAWRRFFRREPPKKVSHLPTTLMAKLSRPPEQLPHSPKRQIQPTPPQQRMLAIGQGVDAMKSQP